VGTDAVRFPRGDQHFVCGYLPQNSLKNSLLAEWVGPDVHAEYSRAVTRIQRAVKIDLVKQTLDYASGRTVEFAVVASPNHWSGGRCGQFGLHYES